MPAQLEEPVGSEVAVRPSAVLELMWVVHNCCNHHHLSGRFEPQNALRERFAGSLDELWHDGARGAAETVVLGVRSGTLFDLDLERFFNRLDRTAAAGGPQPSLLSEHPTEQEPFRRRLDRLRDDAGLRRTYVDLLQAVWSAVEPEWNTTGRAAVVAEGAVWARKLGDGADYHEMLGRSRLWKGRPEFDAMADTAAAEGRLVLSPGWFFGDIHIVELDGDVFLGRGVHPMQDEAAFRKVAAGVSSSVKALADPTRVAILLWVAQQPASVTEVARHFGLSQPTVSAHVRLLREADLLHETPAGRSAKLSASEDGLRRLFSNAQQSLVKMFRS